ncbi:MAG: UDP-N-acetylmuramoyl-L-alanyl-D-glutamate--2,6-diaminopimelate ligase [Hyphomicrobiaceae bacterium]
MASPAVPTALSHLIGPETIASADAGAVVVSGITADSRKSAPGMLFAAMPGTRVDGTAFAEQAVAHGAVAVLCGANAALPAIGVPVLRAEDPRRALALMAARLYGRQPGIALAVTGTSGKTSVAEFTRQILAACGRQAASLGTLGVVKPAGAVYGSLTTPDPVTLAATLADLAREGITHLAFEASSHGLDQRRLDGVKLSAAAFTNLGRDHLDYHVGIEDYLAAKLRLFDTLLEPGKPAVVNTDGARAADVMAVIERRAQRLISVGKAGQSLRLTGHRLDGFAQMLEIACEGRNITVRLPLIGAYQVENALTAAGLALAAGEAPSDVLAALEGLLGVPGRLDVVGEAKGGLALVDYAHKPEALAAALEAVRPFATGRVITVFGCGGDRDKGKRPIMGGIAARQSHVVIVTDDNPRSENPAGIRAEILSGIADRNGAGDASVEEIGDRREAIRTAVRMMRSGDVVLVAGKGHETGQIVGDTILPFSDRDELTAALDEVR